MKENSLEKINIMLDYIQQIRPGDPSNREAHAAKVYFHELFGKNFKRDSDHYINKLLNYGYTIIRAAFSRTIVSKGLQPIISIFHCNKYNSFALADDLMEPFRPIVDNYVYRNLMTRDYFSKREKIELINLLNSEVIFNQKRIVLSQAINEYVDQIINALDSELVKYEYPFASSVRYYEL